MVSADLLVSCTAPAPQPLREKCISPRPNKTPTSKYGQSPVYRLAYSIDSPSQAQAKVDQSAVETVWSAHTKRS